MDVGACETDQGTCCLEAGMAPSNPDMVMDVLQFAKPDFKGMLVPKVTVMVFRAHG